MRTEEAIVWLEEARIGNPGSPWPRAWLASAYGLKGDLARAAAELAEARRLLGARAYPSIAAMTAGYWGVPAIRARHEATFFAGLQGRGPRGMTIIRRPTAGVTRSVEAVGVIGAAMAELGVVGVGRLTLSRRERMVMVEPRTKPNIRSRRRSGAAPSLLLSSLLS